MTGPEAADHLEALLRAAPRLGGASVFREVFLAYLRRSPYQYRITVSTDNEGICDIGVEEDK
jgi:hypothetical protein